MCTFEVPIPGHRVHEPFRRYINKAFHPAVDGNPTLVFNLRRKSASQRLGLVPGVVGVGFGARWYRLHVIFLFRLHEGCTDARMWRRQTCHTNTRTDALPSPGGGDRPEGTR